MATGPSSQTGLQTPIYIPLGATRSPAGTLAMASPKRHGPARSSMPARRHRVNLLLSASVVGPQGRSPWVPATLSPSAAQGAQQGRGRERRRRAATWGQPGRLALAPGAGGAEPPGCPLRPRGTPLGRAWPRRVCKGPLHARRRPRSSSDAPRRAAWSCPPGSGRGTSGRKGRPHPRRLGSTPITGSRRLLTGTQWFEKGIMTLALGVALWAKRGTLGSLVRGGRSAN